MKKVFLTAVAAAMVAFAANAKKNPTIEVYDFSGMYENILIHSGKQYQPKLTTENEGGYIYYMTSFEEDLTIMAIPDKKNSQGDKIVIQSSVFTMAISRNGDLSVCRAGRGKINSLDRNRCSELIHTLKLHFE